MFIESNVGYRVGKAFNKLSNLFNQRLGPRGQKGISLNKNQSISNTLQNQLRSKGGGAVGDSVSLSSSQAFFQKSNGSVQNHSHHSGLQFQGDDSNQEFDFDAALKSVKRGKPRMVDGRQRANSSIIDDLSARKNRRLNGSPQATSETQSTSTTSSTSESEGTSSKGEVLPEVPTVKPSVDDQDQSVESKGLDVAQTSRIRNIIKESRDLISKKVSLVDTRQGRNEARESVKDMNSALADLDKVIASKRGLNEQEMNKLDKVIDGVIGHLNVAEKRDVGSSKVAIDKVQADLAAVQTSLANGSSQVTKPPAKGEPQKGLTVNDAYHIREDLRKSRALVSQKISLIDTKKGQEEARLAVKDMDTMIQKLDQGIRGGRGFSADQVKEFETSLGGMIDHVKQAGVGDLYSSKDALNKVQADLEAVQNSLANENSQVTKSPVKEEPQKGLTVNDAHHIREDLRKSRALVSQKISLIDTKKGQEEARLAVKDMDTMIQKLDQGIRGGRGFSADQVKGFEKSLDDMIGHVKQAGVGDLHSSKDALNKVQGELQEMKESLAQEQKVAEKQVANGKSNSRRGSRFNQSAQKRAQPTQVTDYRSFAKQAQKNYTSNLRGRR